MSSPSIYDARVLLPGLNLTPSKGVPVPEEIKLLNSDGSILVFIKKFEGSLSLFGNEKLILEAVYQSRGTSLSNAANETDVDIVQEPDEEDPDSWLNDDPWDPDLDNEFVDPEFEKQRLVDEMEWAKKCIDSPSIDGYDSFLLRPNEIWKATDKTIEEIELSLFFTKTGATPSELSEHDEFQVVEIGETYKLSLADADNSFASNILILEWDFNNTLMMEVAAPREIEVLKREIEVPDDLLLLGMHGGQNFVPSKKLAVHVHLNDYLNGDHGGLTLKLYKDCEIKPDVLKTFSNMASAGIKKVCTSNTIGSFSASRSSEDYVTFEIDPSSLLQALNASADNYFVSVLQDYQDEEKPVQTIIDAIESSQFAVVIEDGRSGENIAEFLLSSITSNDMYFDNVIQMLKSQDKMSYEKITDWSIMITRTEEAIWDSLYRDADYRQTRFQSVPLETDDKVSQEFVLKFTVPDIDTDLATVDPHKDIAILVEKIDRGISFVGREKNREFLFLRNPRQLAKEGNDHMMEFKWSAIDTGSVQRKLVMKVSIIIGVEDRRPIKIGRTVSMERDVGGTSKQHIAAIRMRHMVKNGFESTLEIQRNISHFVEATFKMIFAFSASGELSLSLVHKAADDIASKFYRDIANQSNSGIYASIKNSSLLTTSNLDILDNVRELNESEVATFILEIFSSFDGYDLLGWAQSMTNDEDSLSIMQGDETIDEFLQKFVENIRQVLGMNLMELTSQLEESRELMRNFIDAAQLVRDEIDGKKIVEEPLDIPEFNEEEYNNLSHILNESSVKEIESQSAEILENMEEQIQSTMFLDEHAEDSTVYMENVSAMETNLLKMLESASEQCDLNITFIEGCQGYLLEVNELLKSVRNFGDNIRTLSMNATRLKNFVVRFWNAFQVLARVSFGPLVVLKTIASVINVPMKMLLKVLDQGAKKIKTFASTVDGKLNRLVTRRMINRVGSLSNTAGTPVPGLERLVEIIDMIISVAEMGIIPVSLISKFTASTSLQTFFKTLSESMGTVKDTVSAVYNQTNAIAPHMNSMRTFSNEVASKLAILTPVDAILNRLQPLLDQVRSIWNRLANSWWGRRLLPVAMRPIEWVMNTIVGPLRSRLNSLVRRLDPFAPINSLLSRFANPLRLMPSDILLNTGLDSITNVTSLQNMINKLPLFNQMQDSVILGVAIIQRCFYGMVEAMIIQGGNNIDDYKTLVGSEFKVVEDLLKTLQIQSPDATLSDAMLQLKQSFSGPIAKIDSFLTMNASNNGHTFEDGFTSNQYESYIGSSNYILTHHAINPSQDKASALFEYGKEGDVPKNSWIMSVIAVLLHYAKITDQAEQFGIILSRDKVSTSFMPNHKGNGKFTVSMKPTIAGGMETIEVDSRLPIREIVLDLSTFDSFPSDIYDYANERIIADVHPIFSERPSLALVEKVIFCNLLLNSTESIGTAMHLLSGNTSGYCYKRESSSSEWTTYVGNGFGHQSGLCDTLAMTATTDGTKSEQDIINLLKNRSMSMAQVEQLESNKIPASDKSSLEEAMKELSMFIVVMSGPTSSLRTLSVPSTSYSWDFSDPNFIPDESIGFHGGVQIGNAPEGIRALRIDTNSKHVTLPVNINPRNMNDCTIVIGVYLVAKENNLGWVLSCDNGGYDRGIVLHDTRFKGMGMPTGSNRSVWNNDTEGQPRMRQWMHIAAVYRHGSSANGSFHVDGTAAPISVMENNIWGGNHHITVGTNPLSPHNHWVNCWVKEVKVFNRALNGNEIKQLNNQFKKDFQKSWTPSSGVAHPILYTDDTADSNIVYANGSNIQPLHDLSNVSEVWEYCVTGSSGSQSLYDANATRSAPTAPIITKSEKEKCLTKMFQLQCQTSIEPNISTEEVFSKITTRSYASIPASSTIDLKIIRTFSDNESTPQANSSINDVTPLTWGMFAEKSMSSVTLDAGGSSQARQERLQMIISGLMKNVRNDRVFIRVLKVDDIVTWNRSRYVITGLIKNNVSPGGKGRLAKYSLRSISSLGTPAGDVYNIPVRDIRRAEFLVTEPEYMRLRKIFPHYPDHYSNESELKTADRRREQYKWRKNSADNRKHVKYWGLQLHEFAAYINNCKTQFPSVWAHAKYRTNPRGFVSIKNFVDVFITRQTQKVGTCIALQLNRDIPRRNSEITEAKVFVNAAWSEDIEQVKDILIASVGKQRYGDDQEPFSLFSTIWFLPISLYHQGTDGFDRSIILDDAVRSCKAVFTIQTGVVNAFSNLWVVSAMEAANRISKPNHFILSSDWKDKYVHEQIAEAKYGWTGGENPVYRRINLYFTNEKGNKVLLQRVELPHGGRFSAFQSLNYLLMDKEEWGVRMEELVEKWQPILRINVIEGMGSRVSTEDQYQFNLLDKDDFWFDMQSLIVEKQIEAAGAVESGLPFSLMYEFKRRLGDISNVDCIRKVLKNPEHYTNAARNHRDDADKRIFPFNWDHKLSYPDEKGRVFLEFQQPEALAHLQATAFFQTVMGLNDNYDPPAVNLLSFGADPKFLGKDLEKFNMTEVQRLSGMLNCAYVDSDRLPALASSYRIDGITTHSFNVWWKKYYQKAMIKAEIMTFIISEAWFASANCWEELEWAAIHRKSKITLFVFTSKDLYNKLENLGIYIPLKPEGNIRKFNWKQLKSQVRFDGPHYADNVDDINVLINIWKKNNWWPDFIPWPLW